MQTIPHKCRALPAMVIANSIENRNPVREKCKRWTETTSLSLWPRVCDRQRFASDRVMPLPHCSHKHVPSEDKCVSRILRKAGRKPQNDQVLNILKFRGTQRAPTQRRAEARTMSTDCPNSWRSHTEILTSSYNFVENEDVSET